MHAHSATGIGDLVEIGQANLPHLMVTRSHPAQHRVAFPVLGRQDVDQESRDEEVEVLLAPRALTPSVLDRASGQPRGRPTARVAERVHGRPGGRVGRNIALEEMLPQKLSSTDIDSHDLPFGTAGSEEPEEAGETLGSLDQLDTTGGPVVQPHVEMVRPLRGDPHPRNDLREDAEEADVAREVGAVRDPRSRAAAAERTVLAEEELHLWTDGGP